MRAIVTGSNGFIGANLASRLVGAGWDVWGIDDLSSGLRSKEVTGVHYLYKGIEDTSAVVDLVRSAVPHVVFHLAAIPRVAYSVDHPMRTAHANVVGTVSVLQAIRDAALRRPPRLVFSSSSSVYGGADTLPTPEQHPCKPKSPYALEKHQGEAWCAMFSGLYGIDTVVLRYFNVFGPGALYGGAYSTVLSAWLYHLLVDSSSPAYLEGDGLQTRDFCFVDNVVEANILAGTRDSDFGGDVFNIAQGQAHSLLDCRDLVERIVGRRLHLEPRPARTGDVRHTLADIGKARQLIGYQPTVDFEAQVHQMVTWYRSSYPRQVPR